MLKFLPDAMRKLWFYLMWHIKRLFQSRSFQSTALAAKTNNSGVDKTPDITDAQKTEVNTNEQINLLSFQKRNQTQLKPGLQLPLHSTSVLHLPGLLGALVSKVSRED